MTHASRSADTSKVWFLREWARRPLSVAAVAPSSKQLARRITSEISAESGPVIELGPGTGVFTQALLERGVKESDLTLIELNPRFAAALQCKFPKATVLNTGAQSLVETNVLNGRLAGAVVSGLGLLSMPRELVVQIMSGVRQHLAPGASFYQFTYGGRCPVAQDVLDELNLKEEAIGRALWNLPPASVYKVTPRLPS